MIHYQIYLDLFEYILFVNHGRHSFKHLYVPICILYLITKYLKDFPGGSDGKATVYNVRDWVRSLGWEDSPEKEMATHSSTLALKIPWMEEMQATIHGVAKSLA